MISYLQLNHEIVFLHTEKQTARDCLTSRAVFITVHPDYNPAGNAFGDKFP